MKKPLITAGRVRLAVKLAALALFLALSLFTGLVPAWLSALGQGGATEDFALSSEIAPGWLKGVLPALSPLNAFASSLSQRSLCLAGVLALALLALAVAVWRGRLFCAWVCPMGTVAELEAKIFSRGLFKKTAPRVNGAFFWAILVGAILGFPALLAFEPLSSFNRLALGLHWPFALAAVIPACFVLAVLLLGLFKPMLWCSNVCPLGFALGFAQRLRLLWAKLARKEKPEAESVSEIRRDILKGLCVGAPLALGAKALMALPSRAGAFQPVLPPGAVPAPEFYATCTRCYACVAACPSKVLTVEMPKDADLPAWFAPRLVANKFSCWEDCNRCSQVCAPGALRPLSKDEKRGLQIGIAKIDRKKCLAWAQGQQCMVCDEYCPYKAIDTDAAADGTPRPVVAESRCRGCGFCQMSCPAAAPGPAIIVDGVRTQKRLS